MLPKTCCFYTFCLNHGFNSNNSVHMSPISVFILLLRVISKVHRWSFHHAHGGPDEPALEPVQISVEMFGPSSCLYRGVDLCFSLFPG